MCRLVLFGSQIYGDVDEPISSCSTRNQALLWLSSGNDYEFDAKERRQRFALAVAFISMEGPQWNEQEGWLSEDLSCNWDRVDCDSGTNRVQTLDLSQNGVVGLVRRRASY